MFLSKIPLECAICFASNVEYYVVTFYNVIDCDPNSELSFDCDEVMVHILCVVVSTFAWYATGRGSIPRPGMLH